MTTLGFWRSAWKFDYFAAALCAAACWLYWRVIKRTGAARGAFDAKSILCFAAAEVVVALALISPIGVLAQRFLFTAHMLQHLLLLLVAPALFLLALPKTESGAAGRSHRTCGLNWLCGVGAMWLWHVPKLCNAAETGAAAFHVQTVSLLVCGGLFWWPVSGPVARRHLPPLAGIIYLLSACFACTLLGIYLTFAPVSVCPVFLHASDTDGILSLVRQQWGITPMVDQSLGGLMMWVPACSIYLIGILGLLARWYRSDRPGTVGEISLPAMAAKQT